MGETNKEKKSDCQVSAFFHGKVVSCNVCRNAMAPFLPGACVTELKIFVLTDHRYLKWLRFALSKAMHNEMEYK